MPTAPAPRYARADDLAVVVCHFNPSRYRTRRENLARFSAPFAGWGDAFLVVECATGDDDFEAEAATIRLRARTPLWQKERLLSLGIERLPPRFTKVAWLDADILFDREDWALAASAALEDRPILQPFSRAIRLRRDAPQTCRDGEAWESFASVHARRPDLHLHGHFDLHGHTGFAWAARREVLPEGLYDRCLSGAADHLLSHALCGDFRSPCVVRTLSGNTRLRDHFAVWGRALHERVRARIGCVEGDIVHLWHGERAARRHSLRSRELAALDFSPEDDVRVGADGCLELARDLPRLAAWSRSFFDERREDGE